MVDVTDKAETARVARAGGSIVMQAATLRAILDKAVPKGDVLGVAKIAGIMAAKRTAELVPLCHPLPLTNVDVKLLPDDTLPGITVEAVASTVSRTGVEMEAITAVAVTLITVYDMAKAVDSEMQITNIRLLEKHGGRRGSWRRA
jgi:cyclic pyranopterin phosphate synthase